MAIETPRFLNCRTGKMFVIEHHPVTDRPAFWVVSLNSGLQCRTGPRRLYVALARRLAASGVGVVRVDLPGVGDSDGPCPDIHFDMHQPEDVEVVVDHVNKTLCPKGIILHGLCAGARVAVKTAAENPSIEAVLAWSTSILTTTPGMPSAPEGPRHGISKAVAEYNKARVFKVLTEAKFLRPSFWWRHLNSARFIPELKRTFWSVSLLLRKKAPDVNEGRFVGALRSCTGSHLPIQFLYGERDTCAYQELRDLDLGIPEEDLIIIPNGTHTLSTADQKEEAVEQTYAWLQKRLRLGAGVGA